jgi:GMP synthase (glutamine-hydrolysing)
VQAFQSGHAFGFQFHPDVTYAMMHRWTTRGCVRMDQPGAHPRHLHFEGRAVHDLVERAWLKNFIHGWLARTPRPAMLQAAE